MSNGKYPVGLKRRYYFVEHVRGVSIRGLWVGALGATGYLEALERCGAWVQQHGQRRAARGPGAEGEPSKLRNVQLIGYAGGHTFVIRQGHAYPPCWQVGSD